MPIAKYYEQNPETHELPEDISTATKAHLPEQMFEEKRIVGVTIITAPPLDQESE